jgi:hypothetical protein
MAICVFAGQPPFGDVLSGGADCWATLPEVQAVIAIAANTATKLGPLEPRMP